MGDEPYVPTTIPVNIHSLENELYLADFATIPLNLQPSLTRVLRRPEDSNGHTILIQDDSSVTIDGVDLKEKDVTGTNFIHIGKYILIKNSTNAYGQAINTPEPYLGVSPATATAATPFPPNVPGIPSFPQRGAGDAPAAPPATNNYAPPTATVPNTTGGVSPYNYFIGHPYRDEAVIDIKKPEFGIYQIVKIEETPTVAIDTITLTRTRESLDILPGSTIYVCNGNVNKNKQFIYTSTDDNFALGFSGRKPGFLYNENVRTVLTGTVDTTTTTLVSGTILSIPVSASPITITTTAAHGLIPGDRIEIAGTNSTPVIDGNYIVQSTPLATTFTINIPAPVTVLGNTGTFSTGITLKGIATKFLSELKVGDDVLIEIDNALQSRTVDAILSQIELITTAAFSGTALTTTLLSNNEILADVTQSVVSNYTLVLSGDAGAVFGDGTANKIFNNGDFDFNNVLAVNDKIFVDAPSNNVFTITTINSAIEITVTPNPGAAFTERQLFRFSSTTLVTGSNTTFAEDVKLGRLCIGNKIVFEPTDANNREEGIIAAVLDNEALILEEEPTGDTHACIIMEVCQISDVTIKDVVANTEDPLVINKVEANCIDVCNTIVIGPQASQTTPGVCDFYMSAGTFELDPAVTVIFPSGGVPTPLYTPIYVSQRMEAFQITNWRTRGMDHTGVGPPFDPADPPTGTDPSPGVAPEFNPDGNLQVFSDNRVISFKFDNPNAEAVYGSSPTVPGENDLIDIQDITILGTITADTLQGPPASDLIITTQGGNDIDFDCQALKNIDSIELKGTGEITTDGVDLTINPSTNTTSFSNGDICDVDELKTTTLQVNVITTLAASITMNTAPVVFDEIRINDLSHTGAGPIEVNDDLDLNNNDIIGVNVLSVTTFNPLSITVNTLTVNTSLTATGININNTGGTIDTQDLTATSNISAGACVITPKIDTATGTSLQITTSITGSPNDLTIDPNGSVIITPQGIGTGITLESAQANIGIRTVAPAGGDININSRLGINLDTTTSDIISTTTIGDISMITTSGDILLTPGTGQSIITGGTFTAGNIAGALVLTNSDSGTWYSVTQSGAALYAITLPNPPSPGVNYKFIIDTAAAFDVTISNGAAHLFGSIINDVTSVLPATGTTLTMVGGTAAVGDSIEIYAIDATHYYVKAITSTAGGITVV